MTSAARSRGEARRARTTSAGAPAPLVLVPTPDAVRHDRQTPAPRRRSSSYALARHFLVSSSKSAAAIERRRNLPIRCLLGSNGSGKTLMAVHDLLPSLDAGRLVYSTVPLLDSATGELHENYRPFTRWEDFMEAEGADFLADEISAIAASRDHNNLHSDVINRMHQLRKIENTFTWTAPSWRRADLALREVTWAVTECRGYFTEPTQAGQAWAPHRLFVARTYSMRDFDEWTSGRRDSLKSDVVEWFAGPGSREFDSYDTYAAVDRIDGYDPRACTECGKPKRAEYCKGHGLGAPHAH